MSLAELSIKRPVFITCLVLLSLAVGILSFTRLGVDLFPDVTFPVVTVTVPYRGAGPGEIETLVSRPLEEEIGTLAGLKRVRSISQDGVGVVVAQFNLDVDVKIAEQQIRDRVGAAKPKLPRDVEEPVIRRIDPSDQPILILGLSSNLPDAEVYDVAHEMVKPRIEQVSQVGVVDILGARKREIHVLLDREKLKAHEISAFHVAQRVGASGENIPAGKVEKAANETIFRTMAEFESLKDIERVVVNFFGNDVPVKLSQLGLVKDSLEDKKTETYVNGNASVFLKVYRQSGANTVRVADSVIARVQELNQELNQRGIKAELSVLRDGAQWIRWNVEDVEEAIALGIILAVLVVYFFLGSVRSTVITGLALPNSLIGAFFLMLIAGFTINVMTLLALSLAVGLLIDDAIVVRENIFRHLESGKSPVQASLIGTREVTLAVIATTLVVLATFGPVAFIKGVIGQFLKPFALTVCFAMMISLFDALTIAPMLSAKFAGNLHRNPTTWFGRLNDRLLKFFDRVQTQLEDSYENILKKFLPKPWIVIGASTAIFVAMMYTGKFVPKTFLPTQDSGEFTVKLELPPGSSLNAMSEAARAVEARVRSLKEVELTALTVGNADGEANTAEIYVYLVPRANRELNTSGTKEKLREKLVEFSHTNPRVVDFDGVGAGLRPFNIDIIGEDLAQIETISKGLFEKLKNHPALKDVDMEYRGGKPEFRVDLDLDQMESLGVLPNAVGMELRAQLEGIEAAKYRTKGIEYDVRVRLQEDQRDLKREYDKIYVPNLNGSLISLRSVAKGVDATGPAKITRIDRARYIQISADMAPGGGMGEAMADIKTYFEKEAPLPPGVTYAFLGQAEDFQEMGKSMAIAFGLGIVFIFFVLASLYESFVTPLTIMLALPLAVCGSIVGLWIGQESINIFSLLGIVMLLGVASKNSILLVDHAVRKGEEGWDATRAIIDAGKTRLRPILMTTMALIAGSLPIAIGLNEASKQRTSMGVAIIGGLISSTLLTLVVVPAAYLIIERWRKKWSSQ